MKSTPEFDRFRVTELIAYATSALNQSGLSEERARVVAETLVEGDLLGHYTHGIKLLVPYVEQLKEGKMESSGDPAVIADSGASFTWDGRYLPGPWLIHKAIDEGLERIQDHSVVTVALQKCHHIGCLAAYPERVTEKGLIMILSCSDPKNHTVAPFGGMKGTYSPNPIAGGIPTEGDPVIFDISTSVTAVGTIMDAYDRGEDLEYAWLQDAEGNPTRDPSTFFDDPPSTILPLGGGDTGYKGFALGLLVEALTSGLSGHGRKEQPEKWGASAFLQIIDPGAFGGKESFLKESTYLTDSCLQSPPKPNGEVRLPGSRALRLRKEQREKGIRLEKRIVDQLQNKLSTPFPQPL